MKSRKIRDGPEPLELPLPYRPFGLLLKPLALVLGLVADFVILPGLEGTLLAATVAHEGSHAQSYQAFADGFDPNNPYDLTNNITHEESEKKAYQITHLVYLETQREKFDPGYCKPCAIGFGVAPVAKVNDAISRIVTSTAGPYKKTLGTLLFPTWKPPE